MTTEIEWRRRWKPDLRAKPWKNFKVEDTVFLVKHRFSESSYELLISDYVSVWYEYLDEDGLKKRAKKLNPKVEAPISKLLDLIKENIEVNKKGTEYAVAFKASDDNGEDEKILLTFNTKLAGLPFAWKFYGSPATKEQISEHLTCPLVTMVTELNRRQQELFKQLRSKDREIGEYKAQGIKLTRKNLETVTFDETLFDHNMLYSKGFESVVKHLDQSEFADSSQRLYSQLNTKYAWLNRDPTQETLKRKRVLDGDSLLGDDFIATPSGASTGASWNNRVPPSLVDAETPGTQRSPAKRPREESPVKSPVKTQPAATQPSPAKDNGKDMELLRRQELERKLQEEEQRREQKAKKKKKLKI